LVSIRGHSTPKSLDSRSVHTQDYSSAIDLGLDSRSVHTQDYSNHRSGLIILDLSFQFEHVTSGAGTPYPSRAPEFSAVFSGVRVPRCLVFYVVFYAIIVCLFVLVMVSSVLRYTASDYLFGIYKLFIQNLH
jgi:hypothetical protein